MSDNFFADQDAEHGAKSPYGPPFRPQCYLSPIGRLRQNREPEWVIKGLIPRGLTVIYGEPSTGKSALGHSIALSLALGESVLGCFPAETGDVLYLAAEGDFDKRVHGGLVFRGLDDLVPTRLVVLYDQFKLKVGDPRWTTCIDAIRKQGREQVAICEAELAKGRSEADRLQAIQNAGGREYEQTTPTGWAADTDMYTKDLASGRILAAFRPRLVVIDTLSRFIDGDDSNNEHMQQFCDVAMEIAKRVGAQSVVVLHHTDKKGFDIRGASALRGAADLVYRMSKVSDGRFRLSVDKDPREFAAPEPLRLRREVVRLTAEHADILASLTLDPLADSAVVVVLDDSPIPTKAARTVAPKASLPSAAATYVALDAALRAALVTGDWGCNKLKTHMAKLFKLSESTIHNRIKIIAPGHEWPPWRKSKRTVGESRA